MDKNQESTQQLTSPTETLKYKSSKLGALGNTILQRKEEFEEAVHDGEYSWPTQSERKGQERVATIEEIAEILLRVTYQAKQIRDDAVLRKRLGELAPDQREVTEMGLRSTKGSFWGGHQHAGDIKVVESLGAALNLPPQVSDKEFLDVWAGLVDLSLGNKRMTERLGFLQGTQYSEIPEAYRLIHDENGMIQHWPIVGTDFALSYGSLPIIRVDFSKHEMQRAFTFSFGIGEASAMGRDF